MAGNTINQNYSMEIQNTIIPNDTLTTTVTVTTEVASGSATVPFSFPPLLASLVLAVATLKKSKKYLK
jgi:hypothetical protein